MIRDKTVLQADSQPSEILHRHEQINYLSEILRPVVDGERVDGALLYGPTGAGKTCTSKFILERLSDERADVQTAHLDCWNNATRPAILHRLVETVGLQRGLTRSTPADDVSKRLQDDLETPLVVILDEADQIEDQQVLYDLYRNPLVTMVLIANDDEEFFAGLESRVNSRLITIPRIQFRKYTDAELTEILAHRADAGLADDAIQRDALAVIADAAAGDARVAIGILRNVAERAQREGLERITGEVILSVVDVARKEVRQQTLSSLNTHQRVLLEILCEHGQMGMGDLYSRYEDRVENPRSERMVRKHLAKMAHYDLIETEGEKSGREYRAANALVDPRGGKQVIGPGYRLE